MAQVMAELQQPEYTLHDFRGIEPVEIELADLQPLQVGLRGGIAARHVRVLAETVDVWPPIVITRSGQEIIDGLHRYHAARLLGLKKIRCVFFDGDANDAYIEAVRRNVVHGLPLTIRERKRAACWVLERHVEWSDRRIGEICGLAATTVRVVRESSMGEHKRATKRRGIDGRMRPVDSSEVRRQTAIALQSHPQASLREIAQLVGTSPTTVSSVRAKLSAAGASGPKVNCGSSPADSQRSPAPATRKDVLGVVRTPNEDLRWSTDLAFAATPIAATFSAWFDSTAIGEEWNDHVASVPLSRVYEIADEANRRAVCWDQFSKALELRARNSRK